MQSLNKKTVFRHSALVLAMGLSGFGLVACGGNDDYKAQSCVGQANDDPHDCRHFDQNKHTPSTKPIEPTQPVEPTKPDAGDGDSSSSDNQWHDFNYNASDITTLTVNNRFPLTKYHQDENFADLEISGDTAVVAAYYHNRLRSFVLNDGVATSQQELDFARVAGERHAVDAVSGATEQTLDDVEISKHGSNLVVIGKVKPYASATAKGVGLYASQDSNGGLKDIGYASLNSTEFLSLPKISAQALSKDGQTIAVADSAGKGKLMLLNSNNLQLQQETETGLTINSIAFSDDGQWIYVAGKKKVSLFSSQGALAVFKASDLTKVSEVLDDNDDYKGIWVVGNHQIIAQPSPGTSVVMVQWQDDGSQIKQKRNIQMAGSIFSADTIHYQGKNYLAMTDSQKHLDIVELRTGKRAELTLNVPSNSVAFDEQGYVWVLMNDSLVSVSFKNFSDILNQP